MYSAFPTRMIAKRIEKASVDRFKSNAGVGKQGFEWVLSRGLEQTQGNPGECLKSRKAQSALLRVERVRAAGRHEIGGGGVHGLRGAVVVTSLC